jgi:uncharacterized membrane protein HdeD (DUF308 family)
LEEIMTEHLKKASPMQKSAPWWLAAVEGAVAALLGIYLIIDPIGASIIFGIALSIVILVSGALQTYAGVRARSAEPGTTSTLILVRGLIGLIAGGLIIILWLVDFLTFTAGTWMLYGALLVYGLLGIYLGFASRPQGRIRWGMILNSLLMVGLAVIVLFMTDEGDATQAAGAILILFGVLLIIYGFFFRRQVEASSTASQEE